jgi:putative oxidoreductase
MGFLDAFEGRIYALLRIVAGFLFACHGVQKLLAVLGGTAPGPLPAALFYPAMLIEGIGGALVAIGLATRHAAFLCSGTMAVAYFLAHQKDGLLPIVNRGELAAVYAWLFLFIAARGAGIWSVDGERSA